VKKLFVFLLIAVLFAGTVSAQTRNNRERNFSLVTLEGTLKLQRGFIAVESGETSYFVPMLTRYIGFIDGMKEGAKVSVEGYVFGNTIHTTKVTLEGKSYDFIAGGHGPGFGSRNGFLGRGRNSFGNGMMNNRPNLPSRRFTPSSSGQS
jgi:hypothetical protein